MDGRTDGSESSWRLRWDLLLIFEDGACRGWSASFVAVCSLRVCLGLKSRVGARDWGPGRGSYKEYWCLLVFFSVDRGQALGFLCLWLIRAHGSITAAVHLRSNYPSSSWNILYYISEFNFNCPGWAPSKL
jgi:hypothetical protein